MGIRAIEDFTPFWHEVGEDPKTRFQLKPLDGLEAADVRSQMDQKGPLDVRLNKDAIRAALGYGLIGWENFKNKSGDVEFKPENFRLIPMTVCIELAWAILNHSELSGTEIKNS